MSIKNFIRDRVLTFPVLISFLINMAKKSLQVSLNDFCENSDLYSVTKQAFSKARKKLSPNTFILLNRKLVEEFYSDNTYLLWKGFRILAVDGSDLQLPQNEDLKTKFGTAKNQSGSTLAMAKISYAYDVLNHLTLDAQIDYCKTSERDLAVKHVKEIKRFNHDPINDLYLYDRGYPALGFLFYLDEQKQNFIVRCSISSCFGRVKQAFDEGKQDVIIRLYANEANDEQIKQLKKLTPNLDRKNGYIDLRMIVVHLTTGEKELLLTSLLDHNKYPKSEFKDLYNMRWGAEENYKWHKVSFEIENFSGQTELSIEQEIFATVFTANMASLLVDEAQAEIEAENKNKALKHNYKINKRIAVAVIKDQLMIGILDPEIDMEILCEKLKIALKKNVCPVRPNRKFKRPRGVMLKYGCTMRRCI